MRSLMAAATVLAVGTPFAAPAQALTPFSIDAAEGPGAAAAPSAWSTLPPSAFERPSDEAYEPNPRLNASGPRLQCVPFARQEAGVEIFGDAATWWGQAAAAGYDRSAAPDEGAVIVMRGYNNPNRGHVAVVREVASERLILVDHANWLNGGEITRNVPVRDVSANGDWSRVQVWHVPGAHWGGRVYGVRGFISADRAGEDEGAAPVG